MDYCCFCFPFSLRHRSRGLFLLAISQDLHLTRLSEKMLFAIFKKYVKVTATHSGNSHGHKAIPTHAPLQRNDCIHLVFFAGAQTVGIALFSTSQMECYASSYREAAFGIGPLYRQPVPCCCTNPRWPCGIHC